MKILTWFSIFVLFVIVSCSKDEVPENIISSEQVPNSIGDYWKYSIHSFTGEPNGFLEVRVIKEQILPDGRIATSYAYSYPEFTDTIYKVFNRNTLEEYRWFPKRSDEFYAVMRYIFPLKAGMKWAISPSAYSDSVVVVAADTNVTVPAGSFDHTVQLDFIATHFIGNYWNNSHYWFSPGVGIVRMEHAVYSMGYDEYYGIYELVEFRLK